jgi:hypothetical protein
VNKGPWTVDRINHPTAPDVSFEVVCGRKIIAQTSDENEALLLAAAPDLLEVLREIVDDAVGERRDPLWIVDRDLIGKANLLLAKLDGAKDA